MPTPKPAGRASLRQWVSRDATTATCRKTLHLKRNASVSVDFVDERWPESFAQRAMAQCGMPNCRRPASVEGDWGWEENGRVVCAA